jgi:hypothetical protein
MLSICLEIKPVHELVSTQEYSEQVPARRSQRPFVTAELRRSPALPPANLTVPWICSQAAIALPWRIVHGVLEIPILLSPTAVPVPNSGPTISSGPRFAVSGLDVGIAEGHIWLPNPFHSLPKSAWCSERDPRSQPAYSFMSNQNNKILAIDPGTKYMRSPSWTTEVSSTTGSRVFHRPIKTGFLFSRRLLMASLKSLVTNSSFP